MKLYNRQRQIKWNFSYTIRMELNIVANITRKKIELLDGQTLVVSISDQNTQKPLRHGDNSNFFLDFNQQGFFGV